MVKIDKKLEYTLIVLNHLYGSDENNLYSAKEISKIYNIAFDSVSRVMQRMASKGFLVSEQGPMGGYKIAKDVGDRSLLELISAITRKPVKIARCLSGDCDKREICNILTPVEVLNSKLTLFYEGILVGELLSY